MTDNINTILILSSLLTLKYIILTIYLLVLSMETVRFRTYRMTTCKADRLVIIIVEDVEAHRAWQKLLHGHRSRAYDVFTTDVVIHSSFYFCEISFYSAFYRNKRNCLSCTCPDSKFGRVLGNDFTTRVPVLFINIYM